MSLLPHLIWAGVVIYAIQQLGIVVTRFVPAAPPSTLPPAPVEIPEDLVAVANQENTAWAQEEVLRVMRERYEDLRDWNKVRGAFGVGRIES